MIMDSEVSANCLHDNMKTGETHRLKSLLREIHDDYNNPSFDYLQRHCRNVSELESFLKVYQHLFIVENGSVTRWSEELEYGQERADKYFEEKLKQYEGPVNFRELRKHVDKADVDIRYFIDSFYPDARFESYLRKRPHLFVVRKDNTVHLVERESVEFFEKCLQKGDGIPFMSLRGRVGQAPEHVVVYINNIYPGTEFLRFLEDQKYVFEVDRDGRVYLLT